MKVTKIILIMLILIFIISCCSCDNNNSKKLNEQQESLETYATTTSQEDKQLQKLKDAYYEIKKANETLDCVYKAIIGSWSYGIDMENGTNKKINLEDWSNQSGISTETLKKTLNELNYSETLLSNCDAHIYVGIAMISSYGNLLHIDDYLKKSLTDIQNIMAEDMENVEKNIDNYITDDYYYIVETLENYLDSCTNYYTLFVECQSNFNYNNFGTYTSVNFIVAIDESKSECKNYNDQLSQIFD